MSCWYTRRELALRTALLYSGLVLAQAFSGLIAAGVLSGMVGLGGLQGWQVSLVDCSDARSEANPS